MNARETPERLPGEWRRRVGIRKESSVGIDQCAKHFIRGLGHVDAQFHLQFTLGHFHALAGDVRLLTAVHPTQAVDLGLRRLAAGSPFNVGGGDLAGGLIDAVLACADRAQARVISRASRNVRGITPSCKPTIIEAEPGGKRPTKTLMAQCLVIGRN